MTRVNGRGQEVEFDEKSNRYVPKRAEQAAKPEDDAQTEEVTTEDPASAFDVEGLSHYDATQGGTVEYDA